MDESDFTSLSFDSENDGVETEKDAGVRGSLVEHLTPPVIQANPQDVSAASKTTISIDESPPRANASDTEGPVAPKGPAKVRHYIVAKPKQITSSCPTIDSSQAPGEALERINDTSEAGPLPVHRNEPSWMKSASSPTHPPPRESMLSRILSSSPGRNGTKGDAGEANGIASPLYDHSLLLSEENCDFTNAGSRRKLDGIGSDDFNSKEPAYRNLVGSSVRFGQNSYKKATKKTASRHKRDENTDKMEGLGHVTSGEISTDFVALPDHDVDDFDADTIQQSNSKDISVAERMRQRYQQFTGQILDSRSHDSDDNDLDVEANAGDLRESLHQDSIDGRNTHRRCKSTNDMSLTESMRSMMRRSQRIAAQRQGNHCGVHAPGINGGTEYGLCGHDLSLLASTAVSEAVDVDEVAISTLFERNLDTGHVHVHLPKDDVRLVMDPNLEPGILCHILGNDEDFEAYHDLQSRPLLNTMSMESSDSDDSSQDEKKDEEYGKIKKKQKRKKRRKRKVVPPLTYILTVDENLYKRVLHEVADQWSTPCGLYFCGRETEDSRPSILVAFFLVGLVLLALFIPTLIWPTD
jgi:hypothetical protein